MSKEPDALDPDAVHDRESFLAFVRALVADREAALEAEARQPTDPRALGLTPDAGGWYNFTIESYLNAALAWAVDSDMGTRQGLPVEPSWKTFAVFLLCGKIYE
ncbi:hypothetical protein J8F10_18015 [Gemmata sp. G18]|uniref:DUF7660 domain-containing protein n=1 Tax=Gemmata palustris TaxID=2822762 RepID=A0ABS5BUP5_9BACT|nr:hypothetical protein [Gemmata palustris]MBP3957162.1 hypothetical protein [Gemmata palustris]